MAPPSPARRSGRLALTTVLAAFAALAPAAAAAPGGDVDRLERADAALSRQADQVAERLDAARAGLLASRSRLDAARVAHRQAVAEMQARVRAIHRQGDGLGLADVLVGGPGEAEARVQLIERVAQADRAAAARLRAAVAGLEAANRDVASRKEDLTELQGELRVRRAVVRSRLGRARASLAEQEAAARAQSSPAPSPFTIGLSAATSFRLPTAYTPAPTFPAAERGLPAEILAGRSLPGAVTIDPASGRPTIVSVGPGRAASPTSSVPWTGAGASASTMVASWYGPGFERKRTANGESFDPAGLTAAHRTLPFGSWLRVGYGGRFVLVRINDRGPFVEGRDLDLSQGAAERLGLAGVAPVSVEVVPAPAL